VCAETGKNAGVPGTPQRHLGNSALGIPIKPQRGAECNRQPRGQPQGQAAKAFTLSEWQRKRLIVRERG